MKNKIIIISTVAISLILPRDVMAKENYYENSQGVTFSEYEYNYISEMYWNGYQEYISISDYNELKGNNIFNQEIEKTDIIFYDEAKLTKNTSVTSNLRKLTISKSCSETCLISLINEWTGTPSVNSFDVIGARSSGTKISNVKSTLVTGNNYSKVYSSPKVSLDGFGYSISLPNVSNIKITSSFISTKGGKIYGSYQHAMKKTSELISKNYNISSSGYGKVFAFTGTARTIYDNAPGVYISV